MPSLKTAVKAVVVVLLLVLVLEVAWPFVRLYVPVLMAWWRNETTPRPYYPEVTHNPAGLVYMGPNTTALAGYYCIYNFSIAKDSGPLPGYSVQLNAQLSNGYWVQSVYSPYYTNNNEITFYGAEYEAWLNNVSMILGPNNTVPRPGQCSWLAVAVNGDTVYFGASVDGSMDWYGSYTMNGSGVIEPGWRTGLVVAGPHNGEGVAFKYVYAVLALYYWNGTAWAPAPVTWSWPPAASGTAEYVNNAYVLPYNNTNCASVTWPKPLNATDCPEPLNFTPP